MSTIITLSWTLVGDIGVTRTPAVIKVRIGVQKYMFTNLFILQVMWIQGMIYRSTLSPLLTPASTTVTPPYHYQGPEKEWLLGGTVMRHHCDPTVGKFSCHVVK